MGALEEREGGVFVRVRVTPKASRNAILGESEGMVRVALTAPPVEGAANAALVAFLAKGLGVSKSRVTLVRGETSREKTVRVAGMTADEVRRVLGV